MSLFRVKKWRKIIKNSGLFDLQYYLFAYPDVRHGVMDPLVHFIKYGVAEQRNPSREFNTSFYINRYPDVLESGVNPLVHYILYGEKEGRLKNQRELDEQIIRKSPLFDREYYLSSYPDVMSSGMDPVEHYVKHGVFEGRDPSREFDTSFYLHRYDNVRESGINPFVHYILHGREEGREALKRVEGVMPPLFEKNDVECTEYKKHDPVNGNIQTIAFYLPQFHPFPENDEWWGKGFTEWSNVTKAAPNFIGHYQPHLPIHLGFYDLRLPENLKEQARLAKNYGITGFNFYYYWFDGKVLMEKPFEILLENKDIDIDFCLTWANENWTRRWDGQEEDVLIEQNHSEKDSIRFIENLYKFFEDERYIRIDNKPVLIIYRADIIPEMKSIVKLWREHVVKAGFDGLYLIYAQTFTLNSPKDLGFDAAMEFPPHTATGEMINHQVKITNKDFSGRIFDYEHVVDAACNKPEPGYKLFRTPMLSWDNTARRQDNATIFSNFSLEYYKKWLTHSIASVSENSKYSKDEKIVFINAWNEWAEGTHLEPDRMYGYGYLQSTHDALNEYQLLQEEKYNSGLDLVIFSGCNDLQNLQETIAWLKERTLFHVVIIFTEKKSQCDDFRKFYPVYYFEDFDNDLTRVREKFNRKIKASYIHDVDNLEVINKLVCRYIPTVLNVDFVEKGVEIEGGAVRICTLPVKVDQDVLHIDTDDFQLSFLELLYSHTEVKPKVSVIVPSYNHEKYLHKRLDSIANQTLQDFEVILLDDFSSDNSRSVLKAFSDKRPSTSMVFNEANSGTPFRQWATGIENARADIIWVAEDDDFCENNFLETLVPYFDESRVRLVYSQSRLIDENDSVTASYLDIFSAVDTEKWRNNYTIPAFREIQTSLGIRNTIPNASAVLFKKFDIASILDKLIEFKFAGDWFFYLNVIPEGDIVFVREELNYHRRHSGSTMALLSHDLGLYFREIESIHRYVRDTFILEDSTLEGMISYVKSEWRAKNADGDVNEFYDLDDLENNKRKFKRSKNILVVISGYYLGGAEIFPINLANCFAELGHTVYLMDAGVLEEDVRVKNMVSPLVNQLSMKGIQNTVKALDDVLTGCDIDVINSQGWFATDFIQKNLRSASVPWFVSLHGHEENIISGAWGEKALEYFDKAILNAIKKDPCFIYTHEKNLEVFKHYQVNKDDICKMELNKLGMSSALPEKNLKEQLDIDSDAFVAGFVARGEEEKGWLEVVTAAEMLQEEYGLNVHFILIGDSDYVQSLKKEHDKQYLHFLGLSDEVLQWGQVFDVGLLPTFYKSESHPLVIMGYLLCSNPVITTALGNIPEMVDCDGEVAGHLLKLNDSGRTKPEDIANIIREYIEKPAYLKEHRKMARRAFEKFNMQAVANAYVDVFSGADESSDISVEVQKKNLYIHVGLPKTGTSAIQKFLVDNQEVLEDKHGIYYPEFGRWSDGSHHNIAFSLSPNPFKQKLQGDEELEYLDQLDREIRLSKCNNVLLSSECFHLYNNENFIRKISDKHNVKIIIYLRRQDQYLESMYGQNVRDLTYKEKRSFKEFVNSYMDRLYYFDFLENWQKLTGKENFIIKVFDKDKFKNNNIIDDFLDIFSIEKNTGNFKDSNEKSNVSFTKNIIEYKALLNNIYDDQDSRLLVVLRKYSDIEREREDVQGAYYFESTERVKLLELFEEDNNKVADTYMDLQEALFDCSVSEGDYPNASMSRDKMLDITRYIHSNSPEVFEQISQACLNNDGSDKDSVIALTILMPVIEEVSGMVK